MEQRLSVWADELEQLTFHFMGQVDIKVSHLERWRIMGGGLRDGVREKHTQKVVEEYLLYIEYAYS